MAKQATLPFADDPIAAPSRPLQADMPPTRSEARARLAEFVPKTGGHYAGKRNYDFGPDDRSNVSVLSPYIRTRLLTERETVAAVLDRFAPSTAQKFIQEVCWRTYWKGWLEHRPSVWTTYLQELSEARAKAEKYKDLAADLHSAEQGETGIACFDAWAQELTTTNYLHNHARMWFASIWIFTLGLPWQLGADFFYRNLYDGDPATNTLSWRWVAGLHTQGKTYAARASNIAKYTEGRFQPENGTLSSHTDTIDGFANPAPGDLPELTTLALEGRQLILFHEDDLGHHDIDVPKRSRAGFAAIDTSDSHDGYSDAVCAFRAAAIANAMEEAGGTPPIKATADDAVQQILSAASNAEADGIIVPYAPTGHNRTALTPILNELRQADMPVTELTRAWDANFWPHATKGFFKLKSQIPKILNQVV